MFTIAGSNEKGGVGKSSVLVNLCACIAEAGKRVVLVELDRQGSVGEWLMGPDGVRLKQKAGASGKTVSPCLEDASRALSSALPTTVEGFDVICADRRLSRAGNVELRALLDALASFYDYAFLDLRRDVEDSIENVVGIDMRVIIPIRWDSAALTGAAKVLEDMQGLCQVKMLFNFVKYVGGKGASKGVGRLCNRDMFGVAAKDRYVPGHEFTTKIRESSLVGDSTDRFMPCVQAHPRARVSREFRELAEEVVEWCEGEVA